MAFKIINDHECWTANPYILMLHNPCNIFREYVQRLFKAPQPDLLDTQDSFYKALLDVSNEVVLQERELRRCLMLMMRQMAPAYLA